MRQILFLTAFMVIGQNLFSKDISLEEMNLVLQTVKTESLGIVVWDQRSQVVDGRQRASLVGYFRSTTGIAYPSKTKSGKALAAVLSEKISAAHQANGTKTKTVETSPQENWSQILDRIKNLDCHHYLVVKMAKLQFDGIMKFSFMAELDIEVYDSNGTLLKSVHVSDERVMGTSGKWKEKFPENLKSIMQDALNKNEILSQFSTLNSPAVTASKETSDIIITKEGDEIEAKVEEITSDAIKYRKATQPDGPLRNVPKSDVFMIKYSDGTKEVFQ